MTQTAQSYEEFLTLAKEQINKRDWQGAIDTYQKALTDYPQDASMYCRLGDIYSQHFSQEQEGLYCYQQALQIKPDFFWAIRGIGDILFKQGKIEEAISTYEQAIKTAPKNYEGYRNLAKALEKKGELEKAKTNYQKAVELNSDNPWLLISLCHLCRKNLELEQAIDYCQRAIKIRTQDLELYNILIELQTETKNFADAATTYQQLLKLNPPNQEWLYLKLGGLYLYSIGNAEQAISWYNEFLKFHPNNFWANRDLGYAFDQQGLYDKAIASYEKAIYSIEKDKIDNHIASGELQDAYLNLGNLKARQGQKSDAIRIYQEGITFCPDEASLYERLEDLLLPKESSILLAEFYQTVLAKHPQSFEAYYRLGKALSHHKKWQDAINNYTQAVKINPHHWEAYQAQGDALLALGFVEEAQSVYGSAERKFYQLNNLNKSDLPKDFDWEIYQQFNPGIAAKTKWQAIKHFLLHGYQEKVIYSLEHLHNPLLREDIASKSTIKLQGEGKNTFPAKVKKLAVLVHIYYCDLWQEIWQYIKNIEAEYDLFINIVAGVWNPIIHRQIKEDAPHARIIISKNRGRDLGGHLASMDTLDFNNYDIFCLIHTKKSPHLTEKISNLWRQDLLDALLGSKEKIAENLRILRENPEIGCIGSRYWRDTNLGQNEKYYEHFLDVLQIKPEARNCEYISGTMILVRTQVIQRIYDTFSKVQLEEGDDKGIKFHLDGQIAHAIERLIGNVVRDENLSFFWQE